MGTLSFLGETISSGADYIIIVDRMLTDGSIEITQEYPKVALVDDNR